MFVMIGFTAGDSRAANIAAHRPQTMTVLAIDDTLPARDRRVIIAHTDTGQAELGQWPRWDQ
jgi:hypothetical protein